MLVKMVHKIQIHNYNFGNLPDFTSPVASFHQVYAIYVDLSSKFDLISHPVSLHKLCMRGFSNGYVNWFCSYLTNRQSSICILATLLSPFKVFSGVPQKSALWSLLFNIFINNVCKVIKYSRYLLFTNNINSAKECTLLQSNIKFLQGWCAAKFIKINISKIKVTAFTRKTNVLLNIYKI